MKAEYYHYILNIYCQTKSSHKSYHSNSDWSWGFTWKLTRTEQLKGEWMCPSRRPLPQCSKAQEYQLVSAFCWAVLLNHLLHLPVTTTFVVADLPDSGELTTDWQVYRHAWDVRSARNPSNIWVLFPLIAGSSMVTSLAICWICDYWVLGGEPVVVQVRVYNKWKLALPFPVISAPKTYAWRSYTLIMLLLNVTEILCIDCIIIRYVQWVNLNHLPQIPIRTGNYVSHLHLCKYFSFPAYK